MLVTYSLTIRRLRLQAAKCYTDPDNHLVIRPQTSHRLRRHKSTSKRHSPKENLKIILNSPPTPPCLEALPDIDNKQNQLEWP